jgi:membrane associated rhomboid family serine protease
MFLPLKDENQMRCLESPRVTWTIIATCVVAYLLFQADLFAKLEPNVSLGFGLVPSVIFGRDIIDPRILQAPTWATPLTYQFLHGGLVHLAGNMLFLWVFADNVEDEMGHGRFALFYLVSGALAGLAYALTLPAGQAPLIGASGSVSAVLGAYLVLHPNTRVFGLFMNIIPVRIPALWFILGWFALQLGHALFDPNRAVAWIAHVAGVVIGAALVYPFRRRIQEKAAAVRVVPLVRQRTKHG